MKKFTVFIIALAMSLGINAQDYQKLWQDFDSYVENLLPESAETTLDKIEKQAKKDNNDIQLLKTVIKRCEILSMSAENPADTIVGLCKSYLPQLSSSSQVVLNVEIAIFTNDFSDISDYGDNDFIKTVPMETYAEVFQDENDNINVDIAFEPTLYDYVIHCLISNCRSRDTEKELYAKLLAFDFENGYLKAYYNNKINQLGYVTNASVFGDYSKLATECPDNEIVAQIKIRQIEYLTERDELVAAKALCDEAMALLDSSHPLYQQCVDFEQSLTKRTVSLIMNKTYVPGQTIPAGLSYRNTTNPSYKIYKVSSDEFFKLIRDEVTTFSWLLHRDPVVETTLEIPEETDYLEHSSLIALPALKCGIYFIVMSNNDSFDNYDDLIVNTFQVSNLASFNLETDDNLNVYVVNRETGEPMGNVTAHFTEYSYSYKQKSWSRVFISDAVSAKNGLVAAPVTKKNKYFIDLYYENDTLISTDLVSFYKSNKIDNVTLKSRIFTDRAIYRPGQTVQFNYVAYRGNSAYNEVVPNHEVVLEFRDPNFQLIDTLHLTTNEFGAANGSFIIPSDRINGNFRISDDNNSVFFKVEEYKRPTFEVTFDTPRQEYKIGDSITVTGKVAALSGFGLDNVRYSYQVTRKTDFPLRFWDWTPYFIEDELIALGESITLNDGTFNIDFQLSPSDDIKVINRPFYTYEISVTATGNQGETQHRTFSVTATYNRYRLSVETDENPSLDISDFKNLNVVATNINGTPVNTKVECKVFRINDDERYKRILGNFDRQLLSDRLLKVYFPHFDYYSIDSIDKVIVYQNVIDVNGTARLLPDDLKIKPAKYVVELRSTDDTLSAFSEQYVVYDLKSRNMPYKSMYWTNIDKRSAQPGETINYLVGSSEKNVSALVIVKNGRKILRSERISLNNNVYKLSYKVREEDRGRLDFQVAIVKYNTEMRHIDYVDIPFNNMKLDIVLHTERDKMLPGETDTLSISVRDFQGNPVTVPVMAVMYDAALDNFSTSEWSLTTTPRFFTNSFIMSDKSFIEISAGQYFEIFYFHDIKNTLFSGFNLLPLNHFGFRNSFTTDALYAKTLMTENFDITDDNAQGQTHNCPLAKIRKDFNETAFFYPNLTTDENGLCSFSFTMPDALTRWNLKLFTYSNTLSVGSLDKTIMSQQPLMIMADMPRFAYDEDTLWIAANIINLTDETLSPSARLEVFDDNDTLADMIISDALVEMKQIPAGQSRSVRWKVAMKKDLNIVKFKFSAFADCFSDAELHGMPVLSTDVFLTQTYSMTVDANSAKEYIFNIINDEERNHDIRLDFKANPVYYAVQALPYIAESDEKYPMTAFYRYFTNKMARQIIEDHPNIKEMLDEHEDDTLSELQKNEELKAVLLKDTPWTLEADNELRQRANISKLFDTEEINNNIASALELMRGKQTSNGGWPWIDGMPESEHITQLILSSMGRLGDSNEMTEKAFHFIERQIVARYSKLDTKRKRDNTICDFMTMKELYAMSFFNYTTIDSFGEAKAFFINKLRSDWKRFSIKEQAYIALILNRNGQSNISMLIIKSLRERAIKNELGMYWRNCDLTAETHILEAFDEIDPRTAETDAMRLWILSQKRSNMWENDQTTAEAVFAIMSRGTDWDDDNASASMTVGDKDVKVSVDNRTNHVTWGGLYRRYFVPIDKVKQHADAMKITRRLFVERVVDGQVKYIPVETENIKVGDKIKIVLAFENGQDMEFVYLKDLRGACFEPTEQLSRYHYSDGMWYYQSTTDVSMEFFIERLAKGKHELSHTVYVTKEGCFSTGYTQIQCQYAPDFGAYSNAQRLRVDR